MWYAILEALQQHIQDRLTLGREVVIGADGSIPQRSLVVLKRGRRPAKHLPERPIGAEQVQIECWAHDANDPEVAYLELAAIEGEVDAALAAIPGDLVAGLSSLTAEVQALEPDGDVFRPSVGSQYTVLLYWRQDMTEPVIPQKGIRRLLHAMKTSLAEAVDVAYCEVHGVAPTTAEEVVHVPHPALIIVPGELQPSADPGTGQIDLTATTQIFVVGYETDGAQEGYLSLLQILESVLLHCRLNRWGLTWVQGAEIQRAVPALVSELAATAYACWQIDIRQIVRIGEAEELDGPATTPTGPLLGSWVPDIGLPHQDKYEVIE